MEREKGTVPPETANLSVTPPRFTKTNGAGCQAHWSPVVAADWLMTNHSDKKLGQPRIIDAK